MFKDHAFPEPVVTPSIRPFWQAANESRFVLEQCVDCRAFCYPPLPMCRTCGSRSRQWADGPTEGTVWSWVTYHKAYFADVEVPYRLAIVELDGGPFLPTYLVEGDGTAPHIGQRVRVTFEKTPGGQSIPVFAAIGEGSTEQGGVG